MERESDRLRERWLQLDEEVQAVMQNLPVPVAKAVATSALYRAAEKAYGAYIDAVRREGAGWLPSPPKVRERVGEPLRVCACSRRAVMEQRLGWPELTMADTRISEQRLSQARRPQRRRLIPQGNLGEWLGGPRARTARARTAAFSLRPARARAVCRLVQSRRRRLNA